jgi:uncharacterized protein YbaP (TraB family)
MRNYRLTCCRLLLLFCWLAALLPGVLAAQTCATPDSTMLWQVHSPALAEKGISLHLFGSIHVGKPDFYPLPPPVETLFREADHLVFEVDPSVASDPQVAFRMQMQGLLPAGQTLDTVVTPRTLTDLRIVLDKLGIPIANLMTMKPWMITLLLTNLQVGALGYDATWGLEAYFMRNMTPGTEILELESLQAQINLLDGLDQDAFLGYSLREFDSNEDLMMDLVDAWRCGDHEVLGQVLSSAETSADFSPAEEALAERLHEQMFTRRNAQMTARIRSLAADGSGAYFVVVGAGHLLGDDSILQMLQDAGFSIEAVKRSDR